MNLSNMAKALADRDAGMAQSSAKTEVEAPGWADRAYEALVTAPYLASEPEWTIDFARSWLYACGLDMAASERAWGALTQKLLRDGRIQRVGFAQSSSSRGSFKPTYRLTGG